MNDSQRRKADKLDRENVFVNDNISDFPAASPVGLLTAEINSERERITDFDVKQNRGYSVKRSAQEIYEDRRDRLVDLLDKFALAAKIVEDDAEGTAVKFKNTYPRTDQKLITRATSFYNDSDDLETEFQDAGISADERRRLITIRDEFQRAAADYDSGEEKQAEATGGMMDAFRRAMALSSKRDKRIRMKYRDNAAKLAAWIVASHLDRTPKKEKKDEPAN